MKRFTFRLDPVLEYQVKKEEMAVMRQAAAFSEWQKQSALLENLSGELSRVCGEKIGAISSDDCLTRAFYIEYLNKVRICQQETVDICAQDLELKIQELVEARKSRKIMDNLKKKLYKEFQKEKNLKEIKSSDEQAMIIDSRRREVIDA